MKKKLVALGALTAIVASIAVPASITAAASVQDSVTVQSVTIQSTQKYVSGVQSGPYGASSYVPSTYTYADGTWYGVLQKVSTTYQNGFYYGNYAGYVTKVE